MPRPHQLLHDSRYRAHWRALLLVLVIAVAWFAFQPDGGNSLDFEDADKLDHLLAFGSLGLVAMCALPAARRAAPAAALALLAYGGFIELVQAQIPGRTASWADLAADAVGIVLGLTLAAALRRRWPPR